MRTRRSGLGRSISASFSIRIFACCVPAANYDAMKSQPPVVKKVAVLVDPSMVDLAALRVMGFDYFQIHFKLSTPITRVQEWSEVVKPATLWLVPQLPPDLDVAAELIPFADTFVLDTYHAGKFCGTGEIGDWSKFQCTRRRIHRKIGFSPAA